MAGAWDANIMLVHATGGGGTLAVDTIRNGEAFDVIATIRVGRNLMQFVDSYDLFVSVRNLSESCLLARQHHSKELTPQYSQLIKQLRVSVAAGWTANEGDILELIATLKVTAGIHPDYSLARSGPLIVSA